MCRIFTFNSFFFFLLMKLLYNFFCSFFFSRMEWTSSSQPSVLRLEVTSPFNMQLYGASAGKGNQHQEASAKKAPPIPLYTFLRAVPTPEETKAYWGAFLNDLHLPGAAGPPSSLDHRLNVPPPVNAKNGPPLTPTEAHLQVEEISRDVFFQSHHKAALLLPRADWRALLFGSSQQPPTASPSTALPTTREKISAESFRDHYGGPFSGTIHPSDDQGTAAERAPSRSSNGRGFSAEKSISCGSSDAAGNGGEGEKVLVRGSVLAPQPVKVRGASFTREEQFRPSLLAAEVAPFSESDSGEWEGRASPLAENLPPHSPLLSSEPMEALPLSERVPGAIHPLFRVLRTQAADVTGESAATSACTRREAGDRKERALIFAQIQKVREMLEGEEQCVKDELASLDENGTGIWSPSYRGFKELMEALSALKQRLNLAASLYTLERHEEDTLREAHVVLGIEVKTMQLLLRDIAQLAEGSLSMVEEFQAQRTEGSQRAVREESAMRYESFKAGADVAEADRSIASSILTALSSLS